jgi:hypothetical protein
MGVALVATTLAVLIIMNEIPKFSELRVFDYFKKVRNKIRNYYPQEIVLACITKLNDDKGDQIQKLRLYPFWFMFLLIKWSVLYGEYSDPDRKHFKTRDFNNLINLMHDLFGVQRGPDDYENIHHFFRTSTYPQFWLQENLPINKLGRQVLLFYKLEENHRFNQIFLNKFNIYIHEYIELLFILYARFLTTKEVSIEFKWFESLLEHYNANAVNTFLTSISKTFNELKEFFEQEGNVKNISYEFHEQTPLKKYPLLKIGEKYFSYSRELLAFFCQNAIYDILRESDSKSFMDKFGVIFEDYVKNALLTTSLKFTTEKEIKKFSQNEKLVDFVISTESSNVFIDAKGVELNYLGMVSHRPDIVADKTKTSVIKGIEQALSTLSIINSVKSEALQNRENNYLLIISYKDLYLGSGEDFYQTFGKERIDELFIKYSSSSQLPIENIFLLSVDDFDLLIESINSKNNQIDKFWEMVKSSSKDPSTKRFQIRQYLWDEFRDLRDTDYLNKEFHFVMDKLQSYLKNS